MTRNQCGISNCQTTKDNIKTKESPEDLNTVEGITDHLITEANLGVRDTKMDNKQTDSSVLTNTATKQDLSPVEIEREQNNSRAFKTNGDSNYLSLNLQIWKRTKSDGAVYKKRKPTCCFGDKETEDKRPVRSRSAEVCRRPVQNAAGISESPVFFSAIGEWTIVDLDPQVFEKEDAKRISYIRRKRFSYKEVEPESVCSIL